MSRIFETMQACLFCSFGDILCQNNRDDESSNQHIAEYFAEKLANTAIDGILHCDNPKKDSSLAKDSLAYIVDVSRRIALGVYPEETTFSRKKTALESIFNHLNQRNGSAIYASDWHEHCTQFPSDVSTNIDLSLQTAMQNWNKTLRDDSFDANHVNVLLDNYEKCFSCIPAPVQVDDRSDISLFHHSKAVAAIGCCIEQWLASKSITDYHEALLSENGLFMREYPFILYSLDLSGVQSFIYTIANKGALKGLRVRSFYLSILMEHIADTILEACNLFRVNLIYSGGGKAHILLPNDDAYISRAESIVKSTNTFLREHFGTALFLASGFTKASAAELSSSSSNCPCFTDVFHRTSDMISRRKLQRYSASELIGLNRKLDHTGTDRECAICGKSGRLVVHDDNGEMICETCASLEQFSNTLTDNNLLLAVDDVERENAIPLPGGMWLSRAGNGMMDSSSLLPLGAYTRMYCINGDNVQLPRTVCLRIANYRANNADGTAMTFEQLANASMGIKRLGVLRADVDNLGALFASGFLAPEETNPHRYETLPRYMTLSAAMTFFFQQRINHLIGQSESTWLPERNATKNHNVSIVYSGGDDVFLVGAWNEIIDAGLALQDAFERYTGGSVTLSAGVGLFTSHEPVGVLADYTADLEAEAKNVQDGEKNSIALFSPLGSSPDDISFCFHWKALRTHVLAEKIPLLYRIVARDNSADWEAGNAFLYQVLTLLRMTLKEQIAIARLAYLLARHTPDKKRTSPEIQEEYSHFTNNVMKWALEPEENRALQAAILLFVYANRKERDNDVQ